MAGENAARSEPKFDDLAVPNADAVRGGAVAAMAKEDMLLLTAAMDEKGALESQISNAMKASADAQNGLAQALKA